jgi:segregation and condensation protein B
VSLKQLAEVSEQDVKTTEKLVRCLKDKYETAARGVCLLEVDGAFQMCSNPKYYDSVKKLFAAKQMKPLSTAALETLAIIAYKQPITKGQIEDIRGVDAGHAVNRLLELGLVAEKGRLNAPGKPLLFGTSELFLKHFGLLNLKELPPLSQDTERLKEEALGEISTLIE